MVLTGFERVLRMVLLVVTTEVYRAGDNHNPAGHMYLRGEMVSPVIMCATHHYKTAGSNAGSGV